MSNYKSPIRVLQTNFRWGELAPSFAMRSDTELYIGGASRLTNMLVSASGAVSRRPGTLTKAVLPARSRLVEFEFDANEKYVVAFSFTRLDVYNAAGVLQETISGSADCPWNSLAIIQSLGIIQKGDVMIIVHPSFQPRRLRRKGLSDFEMQLIVFASDSGTNVLNQPYLKFQQPTVTVGVSDYTVGTGRTVTSNAAIFNNAWIGERIRIYDCELEITGCATVAPAVGTTCIATVRQKVRKRLDPAPFRFTNGSMVIEITHALHGLANGDIVNISGATTGFNFDNLASLTGDFAITVLDSDRYTFTATSGGPANNSGDGGGPSIYVSTVSKTRDWKEQAWSNRRGWPGAITLHENRLWLGGSTDAPTFLAGSVVGAYSDFTVGDGLDDESVQGQISTLARIVHLVSAKQLQIFTEGAEAFVETGDGAPITPGGLKVMTNTSYGSSTVRPRLFDGATLFMQRNGKNVREFLYDLSSDSHTAAPVSMIASHMITTPIDMAVLEGTGTRPEQYAFIVNANASGTIACYHALRDEKMRAWTEFRNGRGIFDSACVIGTSVFFSVVRDGVFHLDRLELDATDVWLDGAVQLGPVAATTSWALGARYADKTVAVMSNGWLVGHYTANGTGTIVLDEPVTAIVAGYDYPVLVRPLPPVLSANDGSITGEIRRLVSSTIHYLDAASVTVNGVEQLANTIGFDPSLPPTLVTGKRRVRHLGYDRDPVVDISQSAPGPLTVVGLNTEVSL